MHPFSLKSTVCLMLGLMFGMHVVLFMHGKLLLHSQLTASATVLYYIKPA